MVSDMGYSGYRTGSHFENYLKTSSIFICIIGSFLSAKKNSFHLNQIIFHEGALVKIEQLFIQLTPCFRI